MHSPDLSQDNIAKIRALFPDCVTEAADDKGTVRLAVDFDQLRQTLSDQIVEGPQERYRLDWPGKREALLTANAPIAKTLRPCQDESVDFDTTQNLFIEGDNLDALKLLQESYLGKVKMIYIDPPYNTGSDFIYEDDFAESSADFLARSNQTDQSGGRLVANLDSNGRFHSDWLSMMFSRLKIARNLLSRDGVVFVSADDNEVHSLRTAMNEIFGESNFVAELIWEGANKNDARQIGICHEYVLLFAKERGELERDWGLRKEGVDEVLKEVDRLKKLYGTDYDAASDDLAGWFRAMKAKPCFGLRRFRYIDSRGVYKEDDPTAPGGRKFALMGPHSDEPIPLRANRGWSFDQIEFDRLVGENRISFISPTSIMVRRYLHETDMITPPSIFYQPARSASERLDKLFGGKFFDFPKDETIIGKLVEMTFGNCREGITLDFFAGSATTAHAVMMQNAADGGNRQFIMVQLPEGTDAKSDAAKAGYPNIAEISKERIRRAGRKVLTGECHDSWNRDVGFRVLKIDSSNMTDVYYRPDEVKQDELFGQIDSVKPDRTAEDLLFQVLIDWGVELTLPINRETLHGKTVYSVDGNALIACFEAGVTDDLVKDIAARAPLRAVFRDTSFARDADRINAEQLFRQLSPGTELKAI